MDDDLVRDQLLTMLIAGHDTSTAMLAWALYLMGEHPEVMARVEEETNGCRMSDVGFRIDRALPYLGQVIKETLRLFPPIHVGNRFAKENVELNGRAVREGSRVMVSMYLSHRDEDVWQEPESFCPHRFDRGTDAESEKRRPALSYVPFGGGPRNCIGATFAQIEGKIVLARILEQFELRLSPNQKVRPTMGATLEPRPGVTMSVKRKTGNWERRTSSVNSLSWKERRV